MNLREWRESKGWEQADLAAKLGKPRPTYQKMEAGTGPIRPKEQDKIRKLGYTGPWPREVAKKAAEAGDSYITRAEFDELGEDFEDACELIRFLLSLVPPEKRPPMLPRKFRTT